MRGSREARCRAYTIVEYLTLLIMVVTAILAIQVYAKRAMQGRIKESYGAIFQRASRVAEGKDSTPKKADRPDVREPEDAVGRLFSAQFSNEVLTSTGHQRSVQTLSTNGLRMSVVAGGIGVVPPRGRSRSAPPADVFVTRGVDDFSDRPMSDEALFE